MRPAIRFCRSRDGVGIAYSTTGAGPVLVQAPTWLTHLERDWTSATWRHWVEELSRQRRLVRYDLRGCGLSDRAAAHQSIESWVADLEAVVDALGLERFPLLGVCQGGAIAAAFTARHPDRVSGLVVYGGYVQGALSQAPGSQAARDVEALGQLIESGWGRRMPAFRETFACMLMPEARAEVTRELAEMQRECTTPSMAARLWSAFHRIDISEAAARIRTPTLVLHARDDAMVPFAEGRRLATLIPGARFVPLDGCNHILQADEPAWKQFCQEVEAFLLGEGIAPVAAGSFPALTRREREILEQIARGHSNADIASALRITQKTVRNHITNIFDKLAVHRRSEAIVRAREAGLGRS